MTKFRWLTAALVGFVLLLPGSIGAQDKPPLESDQIEGFIASYPAMRALGEQYAEEMEAYVQPDDPFGGAVAYMMNSPARAQFQDIATRNGFSDLQSWAHIGSRVMMSFAMIQSGTNPQQLAQQMQAIRQQIESNPNLTEDQKNAALSQMTGSTGGMMANMPSEQDMAAVAPYAPQLQTLVDEQ